MDNEALKLFYTDMGNREWESVINSKPPGEIKPEDFAHAVFCSGVVRLLLFKLLGKNLKSARPGNRYWAGLRLAQFRTIDKSFFRSN